MKVLVATGLYPPDIGGPATYSKLLEGGLKAHGVTPYVLAFTPVRRYILVVRHIVYFFLCLRYAWGARAVYAQDTLSVGFPAALASLILFKKFVVRVPGDHVWEQGAQRFGVTEMLDDFPRFAWSWHPYLIFMRLLQWFVLWESVKIVVPSEYMARVVGRWGVPRSKIVVIYNGVDIDDVGKRDVIRGLLRFEGKLIVSVGRLVPWKGFDVLIKVVSKLKKKYPGLKLLIVGSGPDATRLEGVAEKYKMQDDVIFAGAVLHPALMRYLKASDIFVLNTSYEGLSHLLLETMAVGIPIVTTRVGGNPEVIEDKVNGYLVEPGDESALESRIKTLFDKPAVYSKMVVEGKKKVSVFTNTRVVDENARLLKQL